MKTAKVFRGEGDLMVDALVAASQARPVMNGPMPGFGRDLVPYFDPGADSWDENTVNNQGSEATSNNNGKKKSKKGQPQPQQQQQQQPRKVLPPPNVPKQASQKQQQMTYEIQQPHPQHHQHHQHHQPKQATAAAAAAIVSASGGKSAAGPVPQRWAGPAFSNSPAPASLPVPSFASSGPSKATQPIAIPGANPGAGVTQVPGRGQHQEHQISPPQPSGGGGGGGGADILAMLHQDAQRAAAASPPQPHITPSAPDLMAMLNIQPPPPAPALASAAAPAHSYPRMPSAPQAVSSTSGGGAPAQPTAAQPTATTSKSVGAMLLTPEKLAAMVASNASGAAGKAAGGDGKVKPTPAATAQQKERSTKLLSMLGVGSSGGSVGPPLTSLGQDGSSSYASKRPAPAMGQQQQQQQQQPLALLLQKLESSA